MRSSSQSSVSHSRHSECMCRPLEQWATQYPITELERCSQSPGPPSPRAVQLVAAHSAYWRVHRHQPRARAEADEGQAPRSSRALPLARHLVHEKSERWKVSVANGGRRALQRRRGGGAGGLSLPSVETGGGWAGSGGGGRGRDGGRDRHGQ